jgi:hypothetical protein
LNRPRMNPLLFMGLIGMFTIGTNFGLQLYRAFWGNQDIWWTASTAPLSIEESIDSFELFISGKTLQKHLSEGSLSALDDNGEQYPVVSKDLTVRLNNWYKVKSSILTNAIMTGVAFGIVVTVLVIGFIQVWRQKKRSAEKPTGGDT